MSKTRLWYVCNTQLNSSAVRGFIKCYPPPPPKSIKLWKQLRNSWVQLSPPLLLLHEIRLLFEPLLCIIPNLQNTWTVCFYANEILQTSSFRETVNQENMKRIEKTSKVCCINSGFHSILPLYSKTIPFKLYVFLFIMQIAKISGVDC